MKPKAAMMLSALLNRYHGSGSVECLHPLSEEEALQVKEMSSETLDFSLSQPWQSLLSMHYSWMIEPLKQFKTELQCFIVSSFPQEIGAKLATHLKMEKRREGMTDAVKHLFLNYFYGKMKLKEVLPLHLLPNSPFADLQTLTKEQLIELVDCLGMYDVAGELKQIVDKQQLSRIFLVLSQQQQAFLKRVVHEVDKFRAPRIGLDQWSGDSRRLLQVLHNRGMTRLSKALAHEHPDFVLHLCYRLDTGRASVIQKVWTQTESEVVIKALTSQVLNGVNYVKGNK